jgi:polyisoprenoid-binding protein YceI
MRLLIALALATLPAPLLAQASPDFALPAGRYTNDKDHVQLLWSVSHMGFSDYSGRFTGLSGTLQLDPAKPAASSVTFTVDTGSVDAFNSALTAELKGDKWFDAAKFPTATFQSTKVTPGAGNRAKVAGNLTLHGVTRPVTLDVKLQGKGMHPMLKVETVGFSGMTTIKRSDFGIATFLPMIADTVTLTFNGEFHLAK